MNWMRLCKLEDVPPNEMRAFNVNGIEMIVLRGEGGFLVIPPSCPHMANHLTDGFFDGCVLTCNKHLWQWQVQDGQPIGEAEMPLLAYEVRLEGDELWVNLERELLYQHQCELEG